MPLPMPSAVAMPARRPACKVWRTTTAKSGPGLATPRACAPATVANSSQGSANAAAATASGLQREQGDLWRDEKAHRNVAGADAGGDKQVGLLDHMSHGIAPVMIEIGAPEH